MAAQSSERATTLPIQPSPARQQKNSFVARRAIFPWLLIAPTLIVIAAIVLYPMLYSIYVSFTPFNLLRPATFAFDPADMFRNYERLLGDEVFIGAFFRTLLMIPMMFAPVLVGFQFAWFFNATVGLVNNILLSLGLLTTPKAWLVDVPSGIVSIGLASIWMNVPVTTIILLAGTLSLPSEVYEAAEVDGATAWQQFRMITLPLLQPFVLIALTVRSLDVGRAYDIVRIMTDGGPANRTEMIWTYVGEMAIQNSRFGLASAMSMVSVVVGVLFTFYLFRQLVKSRLVQ